MRSQLCFQCFIVCLCVTHVSSTPNLIFANILFRHGARTGSGALSNESFATLFPRGASELTDNGLNQTYMMGQFLGKRYVDNGFLNKELISKEMHFISRAIPRCVMSGILVGAGMFEKISENKRHLLPPVFADETILANDVENCAREIEEIRKHCPKFTFHSDYGLWEDYEKAIYDCLKLPYDIPGYMNFTILEAHLNEYYNGIPLPAVLSNKLDDIEALYGYVRQFTQGTGKYHNANRLRASIGSATASILKNINNAWDCFRFGMKSKKCNRKAAKRKLAAYSTQDWLLRSLFDVLGEQIAEVAMGPNGHPKYNSMIIIELYDNGGLKLFYKRNEVITDEKGLIEITKHVRNCPALEEFCPIEKFLSCCDNFVDVQRFDSCESKNPEIQEEIDARRKAKSQHTIFTK